MSLKEKLRWAFIGYFGRFLLWCWGKSLRMTVIGEEKYRRLRKEGKPVIILLWHGRIFIAPFFFRKQGLMPLISPSRDGEIASRIMSLWGFKILRGSASHTMVEAWKQMVEELKKGSGIIIVPDGPKGPNRKMKMGAIKLARETEAYLVPFSFSGKKKKFLNSWDSFLLIRPFSKAVALFGEPIKIKEEQGIDLEEKRRWIEGLLIKLDEKADNYFL